MPSGSVSGYWSSDASGSVYRRYRDYHVGGEPGLTYFIADRFGLGVRGGATVGRVTALESVSDRCSAGASLQALIVVPLADRVGLFVMAAGGWWRWWGEGRYTRTTAEEPYPYAVGEPTKRHDYRADFLHTSLGLPVAVSMSPHVALGLGPVLDVDLMLTRTRRFHGGAEGAVLDVDEAPGPRVRVGLTTFIGASF